MRVLFVFNKPDPDLTSTQPESREDKKKFKRWKYFLKLYMERLKKNEIKSFLYEEKDLNRYEITGTFTEENL